MLEGTFAARFAYQLVGIRRLDSSSACHEFHAICNATFSWMENTNGTALFEVCQQSFLRPGSGRGFRDRSLGANGPVGSHAAGTLSDPNPERSTEAICGGRVCETAIAFSQSAGAIRRTHCTLPQLDEYTSPRSVAQEWQADAVDE